MPFLAAAIVPAVWVPCPLSSISAAGLVSAAPLRQDALSAKSTFGAKVLGFVNSRYDGFDVAYYDSRATSLDGVTPACVFSRGFFMVPLQVVRPFIATPVILCLHLSPFLLV